MTDVAVVLAPPEYRPQPVTGRTGARSLAIVAGAIGLVVLGRLLLLWLSDPIPLIHADEAGYLGNARQLVDGTGRTNDGYFGGYSLLLVPAALLGRDPLAFYELVLLTNVTLAAASAWIASRLVRACFPETPVWALVAVAVAVVVYPPVIATTGVAMSENAMYPVTLLTALALSAYRPARAQPLVLAAAVAAFAYWVSPRGLLVVGAFTLVVVAAAVRRLVPWRPSATAIGAAVATVAAGHVFNTIVKGGAGTAGVDGREHGMLHALVHPEYWGELLARAAGRIAYVAITTGGLAAIGVAVGITWLLRRRSDPPPATALAVGFAALAPAVTLLGNALTLDTSVEARAPHYLYYGRYTEAVVAPALVLGLGWLLVPGRTRAACLRAALATAGAALFAMAAAWLFDPGNGAGLRITVFNVIGVFSLRRHLPDATFTGMLLAGLAVVIVALLAVAWRRVIGTVMLLALFASVGYDVQRNLLEPGWRGRENQGSLAVAVDRLGEQGVSTRCVRFALGSSFWNLANYRFLLPGSAFERDRLARADECGPLVLSDGRVATVTAEDPALALVAVENAVPISLWVDTASTPKATVDALRRAGMLAPTATCGSLPPEAYRASVTASVEPVPAPGRVRLTVVHAGSGAPWLAGSVAPTGGCGHVRIVVDGIDGGISRWQHRLDLPGTMFPGDRAQLDIEVPGDAITALRVALVQEGVAWFRDRGTPDTELKVARARRG